MARKRLNAPPFRVESNVPPDGLAARANEHLAWMEVTNRSAHTIRPRCYHLRFFVAWCAERSILRPSDITRAAVTRYQQHLSDCTGDDGHPLMTSTRYNRMAGVLRWFQWMVRQGLMDADLTSHIDLPRVPKSLPRYVLSHEQVETVLAQPRTSTPLGLRDRALMEVLYSTGLRRMEVAQLLITDIDPRGGTVFVHRGKGQKDRMVPIGARALAWLERYTRDARPLLGSTPADADVLFLTQQGERIALNGLTEIVRGYVRAAGIVIPRGGACHLFRHSMATGMLNGGADVRMIQVLLGHASLETTAIYTKVALSKLKQVHAATHPAEGGSSPA